jgi:hypothetical protein
MESPSLSRGRVAAFNIEKIYYQDRTWQWTRDGKRHAARQAGPAPKLQQQNERIQKLPRSQQRFVKQMLDAGIAQASRYMGGYRRRELNERVH